MQQKIILSLFVVLIAATISFALPNQADAAWWNPFSWFNKNQNLTQPKQEEKQSDEIKKEAGQQTPEQQTEVTAQQNTIAPVTTPQPSSDTKTIEDLENEITTLKANLDNLYAAHNRLVNDHNALLEYTKSIAASKPSSGDSNSDLEKKVSILNLTVEELSNKLTSVCRQVFSSSIGTPSQICPSSLPIGASTLESRIKKLEGGY